METGFPPPELEEEVKPEPEETGPKPNATPTPNLVKDEVEKEK